MSSNDFFQDRFIKTIEECTPEYVKMLKAYLLNNAKEYFEDDDNEACAFNDFDYFNKTTDREHLCMPDEVMLIDRNWNGVHSNDMPDIRNDICTKGPGLFIWA